MTTIEDKFQQLGNSIINLVSTRASRNIDNLSTVGRTNLENIINETALPAQTGNNGKILTTNGSVASWINLPTIDQIFDSTSISAQSGVAIAGELENYQEKLTAGTNITISPGIAWDEPTEIENFEFPNNSSGYWCSIIYDGTKFVALHSMGYISTSSDYTSWTEATQNSNLGNNEWCSAAYDGTKFVALNEHNKYSTSTDGVDWTTPVTSTGLQYANTEGYWHSMVYDGTKFVAMTRSGFISTSTDGTTWTQANKVANLATNSYWDALAYDGTKFVAMNKLGYVSISTDGTTWGTATSIGRLSSHDDWKKLVYDGTQFIALTESGYLSTSTDAVHWTPVVEANVDITPWQNMIYDSVNNKLFAIGDYTGTYITTASSSLIIASSNTWGSITGTLSDQTDLQTALDYKQNTLVSGQNIKTINNKSILGNGNLSIDSLPAQSGNSGKFLTTNGSTASWATVDALPAQSGQSGKFLTTNGSAASWATVNALPSQSGQSGKYLTTDGTDASWEDVPIVDYVAGNNISIVEVTAAGEWSDPDQVVISGGSIWSDVSYGANKFIALDKTGYISTSSDGDSWSTATQNSNLGAHNDWSTIVYGNNKFVAINEEGYISTSTDGTTWAQCTDPLTDYLDSDGYWSDAVYDGTKFIVLSTDGCISTSTDGTTWTEPAHVLREGLSDWYGLVYGNSKLVAISKSGYVSSSTNGTDWLSKHKEFPAEYTESGGYWRTLIYDGSKFIAIHTDSYISESRDGVSWPEATQSQILGTYAGWRGAAQNDSKVVMLSRGGKISTANITTNTQISCEDVLLSINNRTPDASGNINILKRDVINALDYVPQNHLGAGNNITITEPVNTWNTPLGVANLGNKSWAASAYGNNKFVAIANAGYISTSTDGTTWSSATQISNLGSYLWDGIAYGNNKFVAIGRNGYTSTSTDGENWSVASRNLPSDAYWYGICYDGSQFVAVGGLDSWPRTFKVAKSSDGVTWTDISITNLTDATLFGESISYGNGIYVVSLRSQSDADGPITTSTDLVNWTTPKYFDTYNTSTARIHFDGSKFMIITKKGYFTKTKDGINWEEPVRDSNLTSMNNLEALTYDGAKFVLLSQHGYVTTYQNVPIISCEAGGTVDQTYDSTSTNAQSGVAVAQALSNISSITIRDWSVS